MTFRTWAMGVPPVFQRSAMLGLAGISLVSCAGPAPGPDEALLQRTISRAYQKLTVTRIDGAPVPSDAQIVIPAGDRVVEYAYSLYREGRRGVSRSSVKFRAVAGRKYRVVPEESGHPLFPAMARVTDKASGETIASAPVAPLQEPDAGTAAGWAAGDIASDLAN